MDIVFRVVLTLALLLIPMGLYGRAQESASSWCVAVWYPSSDHPGGYQSLIDNTDVIDVVSPFWYSPLPDGGLNPRSGAEDAQKLAAWREAGLLILPTIVSFRMSAMIEDPAVRAAHVANIVALVGRMGYDGIDIDYESFGLSTRDAFSAFAGELSDAMRAQGWLLSVTVHAKTADEATWTEGAAAQDWPRLADAADIFRIMAYDYHNLAGAPGPIGPPGWTKDVLDYAASVTDLSRVWVGLHFYGLNWQRRSAPVAITWEGVQRWVESFGLEVQRDPADMEAHVELHVSGLPRQNVYVADSTGLAFKLDLLQEAFPDLGGVTIWGLGGEDPANWDVLRQYNRGECQFREAP